MDLFKGLYKTSHIKPAWFLFVRCSSILPLFWGFVSPSLMHRPHSSRTSRDSESADESAARPKGLRRSRRCSSRRHLHSPREVAESVTLGAWTEAYRLGDGQLSLKPVHLVREYQRRTGNGKGKALQIWYEKTNWKSFYKGNPSSRRGK